MDKASPSSQMPCIGNDTHRLHLHSCSSSLLMRSKSPQNLLAHNSDNIRFELAIWTGLSGDGLFLLRVVSPEMAWRLRAAVVGHLTSSVAG